MDRLTAPRLPDLAFATQLDQLIRGRRSIRAFLPTPVPRQDIEAILEQARFCPTGVNLQPWQVHVLTGAAKERLSQAILAASASAGAPGDTAADSPYRYYPKAWCDPYLARRRQVGWSLYGLLGIRKGDGPAMQAQHQRNYRFFDAPVGLLFTIDRLMGEGSLLDCGMFLQTLMLAARGRGLDTCVQAAFLDVHQVVCRELAIPDTQMLVCGMSLGHADPARVENQLQTPREPVSCFTTFHHR